MVDELPHRLGRQVIAAHEQGASINDPIADLQVPDRFTAKMAIDAKDVWVYKTDTNLDHRSL